MQNIFPNKMEKYLPFHRTTVNGVNILLRHYKPECFNDVLKLMQGTVQNSQGVGEGEFQDATDLNKYLTKSKMAVTFHDEDKNSKLIGIQMVYDTVMSRSSQPILAAGYTALDQDYQGKGLFYTFNSVMGWGFWKHGYVGGALRNTLTSVTTFAGLKGGAEMTTVIPKSIKISKLGWLPDLVAMQMMPEISDDGVLQVVYISPHL